MESSLIARISGSTVAQLERSFALRLSIILSPMGQWKEPMGKSFQPCKNVSLSRRKESGLMSYQGSFGHITP
jgi:hypothetical protein